MLKTSIYIFICVSVILLSSCTILTVEESSPDLKLVSDKEPITLAVLDKRPYVVNKNKTPAFEGIVFGSFGIPHTFTTVTNEPMSVYLSKRLSIGFGKKDIKVKVIETESEILVNNIIDELAKEGNKSILFVLYDWKYHKRAFSSKSWYDVNVIVLNNLGNKIIVKKFKGENEVPLFGEGHITEMLLIYKQRFESIFSDPEIIDALNN